MTSIVQAETELVTTPVNLRIQLDEIDKRVVGEVFGGFFESRLKIELGIWEKGKVVSLFRGVKRETSYRQLELSSGRKQEDLKRWCCLYEKYRDKQKFLKKYAEPKAETWTKKALAPPKQFAEIRVLPSGDFSVIYADPPWEYDFSQSDSRSIETKYPTMSLEELIALKDKPNFPNKKDASLFLLATAPKLREARELIDAWGFTYRTNAVWDKEKIGMGYWFRGQHEHLLVGVKGDVAPPLEGDRVASVIRLPRTEHSRKPSVVPELIEKWFPDQQWIELFLRGEPRPGWLGWGLDAA